MDFHLRQAACVDVRGKITTKVCRNRERHHLMSFKYCNFKLIGEGVFLGQVVTLRCFFFAGDLLSLTTCKMCFNFLSLCFTASMIISINIMITV